MKSKFILKPIQKELSHLILAYNKTFDEYNLIDLRYNTLIGDYNTIYTNETIPKNLNMNYYRKEGLKWKPENTIYYVEAWC